MGSKTADVDWKTYVELCEKDFLKLTGLKFRTEDDKDRPILEFHFRENSERLVQLSYINNISFIDSKLLIEVYCEEPIRLHQQFMTASLVSGQQYVQRFENVPSFFEAARELPLFRNFLNRLIPYDKGMETKIKRPYDKGMETKLKRPYDKRMETTIRRLAIETASLVLSRIEESNAFNIYMNAAIKEEPDEIGIAKIPPIFIGLHSILSKALDKFQLNVVNCIKTWRQPSLDKQLGGPVSHSDSIKQYDEKPIQFAFAPSGSGKTTSIFDALTHKYGYYMVSSALLEQRNFAVGRMRDPSLDLVQTCMNPKFPEGVSRDTGEIFRMVEYIKRLHAETEVLSEACQRWWKNIFVTRNEIFNLFREARPNDSSPKLWLSFQLNCSEWDPFLQASRVRSLLRYVDWSKSQSFDDIDKEVHWACIDEAQEDLKFAVGQENLLADCMIAMSSWEFEQEDFVYFRQAIFAGTSLNVSRALKTRDKVSKFFHEWGVIGKILDQNACNVASGFPLVMNREEAEAVLKSFGLENMARAVDQGESLWGRVKWTAMYAEKIKGKKEDSEERISKVSEDICQTTGDIDFNKLAEETFDEITYDLCARLEDLQKRGNCGELLDRLLEAAISADILGRPHVFSEKSDLQLVEHGFAIVDSWLNQLESKLKEHFTVVGRTESQLTVTLKENQPVEDGIVSLLAEVDKAGCALKDCSMDQLTEEMLQDGFTIVDCTIQGSHKKASLRKHWSGRLARQKFEYEESGNLLRAKLKKGDTIEPKQVEELTAALRKDGFNIANKTFDELKKLVKEPCTIVNFSTNPLVARLAERVVIEAVIRFFIGNHKLDEKFMTSVRLASTRSGIGHSSEHYLAVQLRRYLSKASFDDKHPPRNGTGTYRTELREKRGLILGCLSSATNNKNTKIKHLDDFALIAGDRTVKNFQSWKDWEKGFVDWLQAIEHGHKPSASFLIPHNDFGPDLVFAMRKTDASKDIVLCSLQLKLGRGSPDAVNKSSVSWACGDRKTGNAEETKQQPTKLDKDKNDLATLTTWVNKEEKSLESNNEENGHTEMLNVLKIMKEMISKLQNQSSKNPDHYASHPNSLLKARKILQNDFWCRHSRLSILVAAGAQTDHPLGDVRPDTSPFDPSLEYYVLVGAENTKTLFGTPFETVLEIL